jgi:hypothetical protein
MMRTINDATYDDLTYIGSWLCEEDRLELALTHNTDDYVSLANDAWASKYKYVALEEAVPVMAFGARRMVRDTALVWGFKTDRGWGAIREVTKFIRRTMIPALHKAGVRRAVCGVHPDNVVSQRWLRHLGFAPRATPPDIGTRLVIFERIDQ